MTPGPRGWTVLLAVALCALCVGFSTGRAHERAGWERWAAPEVVGIKGDRLK